MGKGLPDELHDSDFLVDKNWFWRVYVVVEGGS